LRRSLVAVRSGKAAALLIVLLLPGCGGSAESGSGPETKLTIRAVNPNVGRAAFELSCEPVGGDLPEPERACAALADSPDLVRTPKPFVCAGGLFSWWDLTISGYAHRRPVDTRVSTCWTPQMELIGRLGIGRSLDAHLLPRRTESLVGPARRTLPPGVLEPADLVVCEIDGRRLELGVPVRAEESPETGYSGGGVRTVMLRVTLNRDHSVTADCA
jgi:hypothetical protein